MDPKLHTFLTLCQTMNYRMAAERLHLSQPAVTKQIQALEQSLQKSSLLMMVTLCIKQKNACCWSDMPSLSNTNLRNFNWLLQIKSA